MIKFWYNPVDKDSLSAGFICGLLSQDPSADTILRSELPMAEACCIFWMYNVNRLGDWVPGMTLRE
jgi:hypothetical protein